MCETIYLSTLSILCAPKEMQQADCASLKHGARHGCQAASLYPLSGASRTRFPSSTNLPLIPVNVPKCVSKSSPSDLPSRPLWLGCALASLTQAERSSLSLMLPPSVSSSLAMIFFHLTGLVFAAAAGLALTATTPLLAPSVGRSLRLAVGSAPPAAAFAPPPVFSSASFFSFLSGLASSLAAFFAFFASAFASASASTSPVFRFLLAAAALAAGSAGLLTAEAAAATAGTAAATGASAVGGSALGGSALGSSMSNQSFSAMPWWSALRLSEFLAKLTNLAFFRGRLSYASSRSAYARSSPAQPSRAEGSPCVAGAGPEVRLGGFTG